MVNQPVLSHDRDFSLRNGEWQGADRRRGRKKKNKRWTEKEEEEEEGDARGRVMKERSVGWWGEEDRE